MELRPKEAAETAALIAFHCVICFDAFHLQDRPPMVLPCGHTFVCLPCTKRIRKCMECREPLYVNVSKQVTHKPAYRYGTNPDNNSPQSPSTLPHVPTSSVHASPPTLLPLPIPKNVVLIAMMEAAERQSRVMKEEVQNDAPNEEDEPFDRNHIIRGIATLSGSCGTYVVRGALTVVSCDPRDANSEEKQNSAQGVENNVVLKEGQKCQVVEFENGVAQLARNRGFVKANAAQLVKVGTPMDEACRLEGLLKTVQNRSAELQTEIEANRKLEKDLRRQLEAALNSEETATIVTDPSRPEEFFHTSMESIWCESGTLTHPTTPEQTIPQPVLQTPESSSSAIFEPSGVKVRTECNSASHSSPSMSTNSSDVRAEYRSQEDGGFVLGCGATLRENTGHLLYYSRSEDDENIDNNHLWRPGSETDRNPSFPRMPTQTSSSSFDGIDFRTGLSGHRALSVARTGQYTPRVRMRMMMSQHRGVTNSRPSRGPPTTPSLSFSDSPLK